MPLGNRRISTCMEMLSLWGSCFSEILSLIAIAWYCISWSYDVYSFKEKDQEIETRS